MFYVMFPIAYILIVAVLFDIPASACVRILLSPLYYLAALFAVVAGYGLLEMKRWAWYLFVIANFLILYETALWANDYGESHHQIVAFAVSVLAICLVILRVAKEVRVPYFFPKIPWWENDPRYRISVPVAISFPRGEPIQGEILDLSMGGCFVKVRAEIFQDEAVQVVFTVLGQEIKCSGNVVWRTQSTVTHPKGVGVKFSGMDRKARRMLRNVTKKLKRATAQSRKQRQLVNQEEFMKKLEAQPSGEGSAKE
jgi:hypothetical protein